MVARVTDSCGQCRGTGVVAMCGTSAGYYRHHAEGETPCDMCKAARQASRFGQPDSPVPGTGHVCKRCGGTGQMSHGTRAAVLRHRRRGEELCAVCAASQQRTLLPCGTVAAYARHLARGETPCQPCRDANAARLRKYWAKKKSTEICG